MLPNQMVQLQLSYTPSLLLGLASSRREAATGSAADFLPSERSLPALRDAAKGCRGCHLWQRGTQTVFGVGPSSHARAMFVGEQPGHEEDLAGAPFVGPAGRILNRALEEAGIDRRQVYVTNVVKHSHATRVVLRLEFSPHSIALEIRDNGCGLCADRVGAYDAHQFGLLGMSERAKRLGGRLDLSGTPDGGTTVRVVIPVAATETPAPLAPVIV